jgi:putative redox protein
MDVISLLKKMRALPESLRIEVEAELTEEHPKIFSKIHLKYFVKGSVLEDKLQRAIELSQERVCRAWHVANRVRVPIPGNRGAEG